MKHPTLEQLLAKGDPVKVLTYLYSQFKLKIAGIIVTYFLKHSPTWLIPALMAWSIDAAVRPTGNSVSTIVWSCICLLGLLLINIPLNRIYYHWLSEISRSIEVRLRLVICQRLHKVSMEYFTLNSTGVIQNKLLRDVSNVNNLNRTLSDGFLVCAINILVPLIIIAIRTPVFLLYIALITPLIVVLTQRFNKPLYRSQGRHRKRMEQLSASVADLNNVIPIARAHSFEPTAISALEAELMLVNEAGKEADSVSALFGSMVWVLFQGFYVICFTLAILAGVKHWISISTGDIVLISTYFVMITNAIQNLLGTYPSWKNGTEALISISEIFNYSDIEHEGQALVKNVEGNISFEGITFKYKNSVSTAVSNINLQIQSGETVALVGRSGAGKSTMAKLLLGFFRPTDGKILVDGQDLNLLNLREYRKHIAIVPQELTFFRGTLRENITYKNSTITDEQIKDALIAANAWDFVSVLPDGLSTQIGDKGARLSGGEKQRIAIAAALVRNPKILILDEPTSALDMESEALVHEALRRLMKNRTTLIIAHRLSTIQLATRIVTLDYGKIVEIGSHTALLAQGGIYASFHKKSFI